MSIYADTSVFVALYLPEVRSQEARRMIELGSRMWLTPLHEAEWSHAIQQHVFRRLASHGEAKRIQERFERHRAAGVWELIPLPDMAFQTCVELARRHVARLGARTIDSLHVASALELGAEHFWTFDQRQARLAEAAGLRLA